MAMPKSDELRQTVCLIDQVAAEALSRIDGVCALALLAMQQHQSPVHMEHIAQLLLQVRALADEAQNTISVEAERVGAMYKDKAWRRRLDAFHAWKECEGGGQHG